MIHNLQSLRGVAALMVVLYHIYGDRFAIGQAGVDVFFALSGFLMVRTLGKSEHFLMDRAARILPMYWLVSGSVLLAYAAFPAISPDPAPNAAQTFFLLPGPTDGWALIVAWTLVWEALFYILLATSRRHRPFVTTGAVLVGLGVIGLVLRPQGDVAAMMTGTAGWAFVGGMIVAHLPHRSGGLLAASMGVAWLAAYAALFGFLPDGQNVWRGVWMTAPAALLVYAAARLEPRLRALESVGAASFSLYLTHVPVIALMRAAWEAVGMGPLPGALLLVACIATAFVAYRVIEAPLMRAYKTGRDTPAGQPLPSVR